MKAGVIINPRSAAVGKKGKALVKALDATPDVPYVLLEDFAALPEKLAEFAAREIELLAISGGDGTVQGVQSILAENKIFAKLPRLAILPHGTTNMNAADVGLRRNKPEQVAELLSRPGYLKRATDVRVRRTVKVQNLHNVPPQHGMFLGTGAIYRAVLLCQREIHGMGLKGELATGVTLLTAIAKHLFSHGSQADDPDRIDRGYAMTIHADGELKASYDQLLFLVTTLHRLVLGMRPFWNVDEDRLRATAIAYPHPSVFRYLLPIMYGAPDRKLPEPDFMSFSADRITLETQTSIVIDGNFYEAPASGGIKISRGPKFEYLCG